MVLEWTPEEASLLIVVLQDRPSQLQRQSTSQGNMRDSEPPDICMRLVLVSFTLLIMFIIIETLHDQSFSLSSEDSLRYTKPPVTGPRDRNHDVSVYETCARVILTATCAFNIVLLKFVRGTCAS